MAGNGHSRMVRNLINNLTEKQQRFCQEYLIDLNGTQAAIRAGYSKKTADMQASRMLTKDKINDYLGGLRADIANSNKITVEKVLAGLQLNIKRAMQEEPVYDQEGNATGEYTYHGSVVNKAYELLGKHLGMFTDKIQHTGELGVTIINELRE